MKEALGDQAPLVVMISVFYNRAYCVAESVQSMIDQSYPNLDIILVDDGSTDNTLQELTKFKGSRVKVVTHSNRGFTRSIREAIENSVQSTFIAIHGSGDYSYPDRILYQVKFLLDNNEVVACGVSREIEDEQTGRLKTKRLGKNIKRGELANHANPFSHGEVLFRRNIYQQAGGYRDFFHFTQDLDLWLRLNAFGELALLPNVLYRQYRRADSVSKSVEKAIMQAKYSCIARHLAKHPSTDFAGNEEFNLVADQVCRGNLSLKKRLIKMSLIQLLKNNFRGALLFLRAAFEN